MALKISLLRSCISIDRNPAVVRFLPFRFAYDCLCVKKGCRYTRLEVRFRLPKVTIGSLFRVRDALNDMLKKLSE